MSKNLLGWAVLATWLLMWCSNNDTIKENDEVVKDSITIVKDSVNKTLIEVVDQDIHNRIQRKRVAKYGKIPLLEVEAGEVKEKKNTARTNVDDLVRMYEGWIDDWDEMKEYMDECHEYPTYNIWAFILRNIEWEGSYEADEYDVDEELEDNIITGSIK